MQAFSFSSAIISSDFLRKVGWINCKKYQISNLSEMKSAFDEVGSAWIRNQSFQRKDSYCLDNRSAFFHRLHDQNCNKIITIFVTILEYRHSRDVVRKSGAKIVTKSLHFCNIFGAHTFIWECCPKTVLKLHPFCNKKVTILEQC